MPPFDRELPETLDLIARLVASVSDRLDRQGEALGRLSTAQGQAVAAAAPDHVANATATATARSVRDTLVPELRKIVDALEELNGGKAVLRERLRLIRQEESRASWWRRHVPFALTLLGAYALVLVFGMAFPRVMAEHRLTCWAIGGISTGHGACVIPTRGDGRADGRADGS